MTTQEKLIEGMRLAFPGESQAALARRAGLGVQRFNNYCTGIRTMDVDAVIGCAQALGWDIRATVAAHEIETAPSPRVKAMWRKLAGVGLALAIGVGLASPEQVQATEPGHNPDSVYIMRNCIWQAPLGLALDHFLLAVHHRKLRALRAEMLSNRRRCFRTVM